MCRGLASFQLPGILFAFPCKIITNNIMGACHLGCNDCVRRPTWPPAVSIVTIAGNPVLLTVSYAPPSTIVKERAIGPSLLYLVLKL